MQPTVNKTPRIEVIDALRGFAVMAILLVHSLEHFIFPVYPTDSPEWLNILDNGTLNVIFSLFAGKSYAIFALLFGFTFYIQCHNQEKSSNTSPAGKNAAFMVAKPTNNTNLQRKR